MPILYVVPRLDFQLDWKGKQWSKSELAKTWRKRQRNIWINCKFAIACSIHRNQNSQIEIKILVDELERPSQLTTLNSFHSNPWRWFAQFHEIQQLKRQLKNDNNNTTTRSIFSSGDINFSAFKQKTISRASDFGWMTYGIGIRTEQLHRTLDEFIPRGNVDHGSAAGAKRESLGREVKPKSLARYCG